MIEDKDIMEDEAYRIARTQSTEGWKDILNWIDKRINMLSARILSAQMSDENVDVITKENTRTGKINVTIVNINKDYEKHEIRVWKTFLSKMKDYERIVEESGKGK